MLGCCRWRYIDPNGVTQGPFPAKHMLSWYRKGMLHDMYLPTCGAVRPPAAKFTPVLAGCDKGYRHLTLARLSSTSSSLTVR